MCQKAQPEVGAQLNAVATICFGSADEHVNALPDTVRQAESPDTVTSAKCLREGKGCVHVCICISMCRSVWVCLCNFYGEVY